MNALSLICITQTITCQIESENCHLYCELLWILGFEVYNFFMKSIYFYSILTKFLIAKTIKNTYTVGLPPTIPVSPGAKKNSSFKISKFIWQVAW